MVPFNELHE